jgi:hypothetical protein
MRGIDNIDPAQPQRESTRGNFTASGDSASTSTTPTAAPPAATGTAGGASTTR